jgi:hypothetical protein
LHEADDAAADHQEKTRALGLRRHAATLSSPLKHVPKKLQTFSIADML